MRLRTLATMLLGLALIACGDQPDPTYLITKARIIGATYAVDGDAERATPRPGESVHVELLLTQKEEPTANSWAIIICEPAETSFGVGFCVGEPIGFAIGDTPEVIRPNFDFVVPADATGDYAFFGAVCLGGQVNLDLNPTDFEESVNPCVGDGVGQLLSGAIAVATNDNEVNHSPRIAEVRFDGEPWTDEPPVERTGCADGPLRQVTFGDATEWEIEVDATEGSRETFIEVDGEEMNAVIEELPTAFYATEKGLEGLYSVIDGDPGSEDRTATPFANLTYRADDIEEEVEAGGRVIRFEIVMRDDRGGMDHVSRALCLVPAP